MQKSILIHNPRCSKSRGAKELLEEEGVEFETIDYMKDGLKEKMLAHLPELTGLSYEEMVRKNEDVYKELHLSEKKLTDKEWIDVLIKHPILLERPIFIHNGKAVIARPCELVNTIL
jgi:arsenate reductase